MTGLADDALKIAETMPEGSDARRKIEAAVERHAGVRPDVRAYIKSNGSICPFCFADYGRHVYHNDSYSDDHGNYDNYECGNCGAKWMATRKVVALDVEGQPDGESLEEPAKPGSPLAKAR